MSSLLVERRPRGINAIGVEVVGSAELKGEWYWKRAFAHHRKDHRYFEILEQTLDQGFDHRYFVVTAPSGEVCAVQPFFLVDQDIMAGTVQGHKIAEKIRKVYPRFLRMRTLMMGCAAGEGHVDLSGGSFSPMPVLARRICALALGLGAHLIVLKEFPARYRKELECFRQAGFTRVPSMPMTKLRIDYASFDDYVAKALSARTRRDLRRKLRIADAASPIERTILRDVSAVINEIYPLYLNVYNKSNLKFEKLTPAYFCQIGQRMPEKARFFVWRQHGKIIAFALVLLEGDGVYGEYIGLDYGVANDLHLYYYITREVIAWAIANGYKMFHSTGLNYEPKLHLRHVLEPLDLYVRHTNPLINMAMRYALPLMEPTRYDDTLKKFPNHESLWSGEGVEEAKSKSSLQLRA